MGIASAVVQLLGLGEARSEQTALVNPARWFREWLGAEPSASGVVINENTALTISAYWACVKVIGEDLAKMPIEIIRTRPDGTREVVRNDKRLAILNREASPGIPAFNIREAVARHALTWGNGYAELERTKGGETIAKHLVHPSTVTPKRKAGKLVYECAKPDGKIVTIPAEDMIHVRGPSPDGIVGYSVIKMARDSLGLAKSAERFGAKFFDKGAAGGGFIKHPKPLSPEAKRNIREGFEGMVSGSDNVGRFGILDEGMDFVANAMPLDDAQFLETRQFQVPEVCRWFRMQPHKIAHLLNATFSNIEHQGIEYTTDTLGAWMRRFEAEFNVKIFGFRESDLGVEHDDSELTRGDTKSRYEAHGVAIDKGFMTPDEVRGRESMNPHAGGVGAKPFIAVTLQPLERALKDPKPGEPVKVQRAAADPAAIAKTLRPALRSALTRTVRLQCDRLERSIGKGGKDAAAAFYAEHELHLRGEIFGLAETMEAQMQAAGLRCRPASELAAAAAGEICRRALAAVTEDGAPAEMLQRWRTERSESDADLVVEIFGQPAEKE